VFPDALVPPGETDDREIIDRQSCAGRLLELADPQPPPETIAIAPLPGNPSARRASTRVLGRGMRVHQRPSLARATRAREALDLLDAALMHDQVEIGTRMHPEAEAVEIGDRRDYRYVKTLAAAQTAEHASDCWIGGNHDVGSYCSTIRSKGRGRRRRASAGRYRGKTRSA